MSHYLCEEKDERVATVYLNNYRGFHNAHIHLRDVNFLVGENSTGKTSLIKVLQLLESTNFWLSLKFDSKELDLGTFDDISSADEFEIGFYRNKFQTDSRRTMSYAFLMTFRNVNGTPTLSEFSFLTSQLDVTTS